MPILQDEIQWNECVSTTLIDYKIRRMSFYPYDQGRALAHRQIVSRPIKTPGETPEAKDKEKASRGSSWRRFEIGWRKKMDYVLTP